MHIKQKNLAIFRKEKLEAQGGRCSLCKLPCDSSEAVVDHCHKYGHVRGVIHRSCNSLLGRIESGEKRYAIKDLRAFIMGVLEYLDTDNSSNPYYPTFRTPEQKKERRKKKDAKRRKEKKERKNKEEVV